MAKTKRSGGTILLLLLLIMGLAAGGAAWLDILGLIDVRSSIQPILRSLGLLQAPAPINGEDPFLLERERLKKREDELRLRIEELETRIQNFEDEENAFQERLTALEERERIQDDRENSFNEIQNQVDNKRANLISVANYLTGMVPERSVAILMEMDVQDVIDILRMVDEIAQANGTVSLTSFWLSLISENDAPKAAEIQRKMVRKPST